MTSPIPESRAGVTTRLLRKVIQADSGEAFILLLPLSDIRQAQMVAERIREEIARQDIPGNDLRVTASFGVSQLLRDESIDQFIKRADGALYQAKDGGRNQTVLAQ